MSTRRTVRWARIEYQPNLKSPTDPVPLGIVVEEITSDARTILLLGRVPIGSPPELQLEDTWGPFRDVATGWFETILKDIRQIIPHIQEGTHVVDELAHKWRWNLYLKTPRESTVTGDLFSVAKRQFAQYVKERAPSLVKQKPKAPSPIAANTALASILWHPGRAAGLGAAL